MREHEEEWAALMRGGNAGDDGAYRQLLGAVTPILRAVARRGLARAGQPVNQSEDILQDTLLAVHLKRHTWDSEALVSPWLFAIARNKLVDGLRRRGLRVFVNIDDFTETITSEPVAEPVPASELIAHLQGLPKTSTRRDAIDHLGEHFDQGDRYEVCHERRRRACGTASWIDQSRCQAAEGVT